MGKTAVIFSGQGAQTIGMGKELCRNFSCADEMFVRAGDALGFDVKKMIFDGDEKTLMLTENTQPAVVTMSMASYSVISSMGIKPDIVAGLSLGEYSAHTASGSIGFEDAVRLVKKRGRFMQEEVSEGVGAMAAIIALDNGEILKACTEASKLGVCEIANLNCPGQTVVSGEKGAVEKCCEICKELGAKRALVLPVSAPFHCSLLVGAGEKLGHELENVEFSDMNIPVITNVTADYVAKKEDIAPLLVKQVSSSVRWEESVRRMLADGVDTFIEAGPGKTLSGFVRKISRDAAVYNVEDVQSVKKLEEGLC